jgi:hypothetical protein
MKLPPAKTRSANSVAMQKVFEETPAIKRRGGRCPVELLPDNLRIGMEFYRNAIQEFLDECSKLFPNPRTERAKYYVDFVDAGAINAVAASWRDVDHIGINVGIWLHFSLIARSLLSIPEVLPGIGNNEMEKRSVLAKESRVSLLRSAMQSGEVDADLPLATPVCETRLGAAIRLSEMMLDFVVYHEFGHIARGHLDFLVENGLKSELVEIGLERDNLGLSGSVSRALEVDADSTAMTALARHRKPCRYLWPGSDPRLFEEDITLVLWLIATGLVFRVFDTSGGSSDLDSSNTHPHPQIRYGFCIGSLHNMAGTDSFLERNLGPCGQVAQDALDRIWGIMGLQPWASDRAEIFAIGNKIRDELRGLQLQPR